MGSGASNEKPKYAIEVKESAIPGSSPIYRNPISRPDLNSEPPSKAKNLYENFLNGYRKFPNRPFLGTRENFDGKFGEYKWKSYSEIHDMAIRIGYALDNLRITEPNEDGNSFAGIFSKNRYEWLVVDFACMSQSITSVPMYDIQQDDTIKLITEQTQMKIMFTSQDLTKKLCSMKKAGKLDQLIYVVQFEEPSESNLNECAEVGLNFFSFQSLLQMCDKGIEHPPRPETLFTICYTSGTTGIAKGAMITHGNMIASIGSAHESDISLSEEDMHISYLPLAHLMDRFVCNYLAGIGGSIGFHCGDILKLKEDLAELKPTVFISVPRLFNKFYDAISQAFNSATGIKGVLIRKAINQKLKAYEESGCLAHAIYDRLIFNKVQAILGGRVRLLVTASAPLSAEIMSFFRIVFSCPFMEAYGQTESCGASFLTHRLEKISGSVGGPTTVTEFKLVDVPEMDYLTSDIDTNGESAPRGEICLRGSAIFIGYYKAPQLTSEAIDHDGWLHTGDIGVLLPGKRALKIIDRKKNIFKLSQGEYVAAEKLENIFSKSPFVLQIFVYGDSLKDYLVAVVVPNEEFVRKKWASDNEYGADADFSIMCRSERLKKDILADLGQFGKRESLFGFEFVKKVHLEPIPWTPSDFLTPTQKLMRYKLKIQYKAEIDALYSNPLNT
ncbi:hypothetical protein SteCoe_29121 [Stentor coeruleus]|uniref:AMP-dependent synthetase/ligase domain-containing protein n=1 Tax=Stentor coeruleus TaxID=5963 RepID=A0A1R2B6P6_9CILI|nr:hypothetical protein SteCoe_29121 [Stentor coeruleus]